MNVDRRMNGTATERLIQRSHWQTNRVRPQRQPNVRRDFAVAWRMP